MTNLWKMRFNIVIKEVNKVKHFTYTPPCEAHYIAINDSNHLKYEVNVMDGISSWVETYSNSDFWTRKNINHEIWKK